jgi:hypothetical protein
MHRGNGSARAARGDDGEHRSGRSSSVGTVWEECSDGWRQVRARVPGEQDATRVARVPGVPSVTVTDALRELRDIAELAQVAELELRARLRDAGGWSILRLVESLLSARRKRGMRHG